MNRHSLHTTALGFLLSLSALGLAACDFDAGKEAVENFKILIGLEKHPTSIGVAFVDAATGNPISGSFQVGLSGSPAIVDIYGDPITSVNASEGQFSFAVSRNAIPTASAPLTVRLDATPAGYLPVAERVVLSDTGAVTVVVRAMRPSAPSQGTQVAQASATATASGTTAPITATTPNTPPPSGGPAPPQASIAVPAGAQIQGAGGQALTGAVTTTIVSVDPNQSASVSLLPAGLTGAGLGKAAASANVVAGAVHLSFTVGSTPGVSVSNGTLTMAIPSSVTVNPATGQPWVAWQSLDLYRYDVITSGANNTGTWTRIGTITVRARAGGGFELTTTQANLRAGWYAATAPVTTTETVTINLTRNGNTGALRVSLDQPGYTNEAYVGPNQSGTTFTEVPRAPAGTRFVSVYYGSNTQITTGMTGTTANITLLAPNPTVTVTVTPSCGMKVAQLPSIFVNVLEVDARGMPVGNLISLGNVSSQAEVTRTNRLITQIVFRTNQLVAGKTYEVYANSGSHSYRTTQTVTATTSSFRYEVDPGLCG
jgi:hypothetical protein